MNAPSRQMLRAAKRRLGKAQAALTGEGEAFTQAAAEEARRTGNVHIARRYRRSAKAQARNKKGTPQ